MLPESSLLLRKYDEVPRIRPPFVPRKRGTKLARRRKRSPVGRLQLRHWLRLEQLLALACCPPGPLLRLLPARAVRRDSRARIHLPVQLGEKHEGDPCPQVRSAGRPFPDRAPGVKSVPHLLRPHPDLVGAHRGVWSKHLGTHLSGNQPIACE